MFPHVCFALMEISNEYIVLANGKKESQVNWHILLSDS